MTEGLRRCVEVGPGEEDYLESYLVEVLRRGGAHWLTVLQEALTTERRNGKPVFEGANWVGGWGPRDLPILIALRRLEGRPDPLTIEVAAVDTGPYEYPELPIADVQLLHADGETERYNLTIGGDYRTGRLTRWDFEVEEAATRRLAETRPRWPSTYGGGMAAIIEVGPGFAWGDGGGDATEATRETISTFPLPMANYRRPDSPGSYRARIAYHASEALIDRSTYGPLLVHHSEHFTFELVDRVVRVDAARERSIAGAIDDMLAVEEVVVTGFHLSDGYHGDPESPDPLPRLFAIGWDAVPFLVERLADSRDAEERARLLVALYDLTGLEPPMDDGYSAHSRAIGSYRWIGAMRAAGAGVGISGGAITTTKPPPVLSDQEPLVASWREHARHFRVEREVASQPR